MSGSLSSSSANEVNKTPSANLPELKGILGSDVSKATPVSRPLDSSGGSSSGVAGALGIEHQGMKVETPSGDFLVHKGNEFGGSGGNTVVTPASDMSSAWKESGAGKDVSGAQVQDYVKAGGKDYNTLNDNCIHATTSMGEVGKK